MHIIKIMSHEFGNSTWYANEEQYQIMLTELWPLECLCKLKQNVKCQRQCRIVKDSKLACGWKLTDLEK